MFGLVRSRVARCDDGLRHTRRAPSNVRLHHRPRNDAVYHTGHVRVPAHAPHDATRHFERRGVSTLDVLIESRIAECPPEHFRK